MGNIIGVQNGTLYDILDDNNGTGNVTVGAASFNITCGSLPNFTVTGDPSANMWTVNSEVSTNSPFYGQQFNITLNCKQVVLLAKYYVNGFLAAPNVMGYVDRAFVNRSIYDLVTVSSQKLDVILNYSINCVEFRVAI